MICKTCGNELKESEMVCSVCGSEVPSYAAGNTFTLDSAVLDKVDNTKEQSADESFWPWDNSPKETEEPPIAPEPEQEQPDVSSCASREHFDFKWESKDFNTDVKGKTEDIKFDWGNLFGDKNDKEEPAQEEAQEPVVNEIVLEYADDDDEKRRASIFSDDFFTRQNNVRESYNFYNDNISDGNDKPEEVDTSFEDEIKEDSKLADVQEPTIRVSPVYTQSGITPQRESPFHYEPSEPEASPPYEAPHEPSESMASQPYEAPHEPDDPAVSQSFEAPPEPEVSQLFEMPSEPDDMQQNDEPSYYDEPHQYEEPHVDEYDDAAEPEEVSDNPNTIAEELPAKPFTSADITNIGIFDTGVASPFDTDPADGGIASPFDFNDTGIVSLFGPSEEKDTAGDSVEEFEKKSAEEEQAELDAEANAKQAQKMQDFISQPIVFPFDEETGYTEPEVFDEEEAETDTAETDITEVSEDVTDDHEVDTDETLVCEADTSAESTPDKKRKKHKKSKADKAADKAAEKDTEKKEEELPDGKKKRPSGVVILVDALVVVLVIVICAFLIMKLAPDTGISQKLNQGVNWVSGLFSGSSSGSKDTNSNSGDEETFAPMPDKNALISAQAGFFNKNIAEVVYDENAKYDSNYSYTMNGVTGAKPIKNDYWIVDDAGNPVLYDESAVSTVIKFNSELVAYINGQKSEVLSLLEPGGEEEKTFPQYAASITALEFKKLGIGDILTDGTDFYVFTIETVVETKENTPTEVTSSKVYKLSADPVTGGMRIIEIETVS